MLILGWQVQSLKGESNMNSIAIIKRKLKPGKTYEDFRKAWYHTQGFGVKTIMYTMMNAFDPGEIIVIGFMDLESEQQLQQVLKIDVEERLDNSLDDIIEPSIERDFGALLAIDDFSPDGELKYTPAAVDGKITNLEEVSLGLQTVAQAITQASEARDRMKKDQA